MKARKNVALLSLCQALSSTGLVILVTSASLIGYALAQNKALATLPLALLQIANMVTTIPAAWLMQYFGRKLGFMTGVIFGVTGAVLGVQAIFSHSFVLFCAATLLFGVSRGFGNYYRFAAAEVATESFRSQAISFVLAGGIIAALFGPPLANWSKDWLNDFTFAGSLLVIIVLQVLNIALLLLVDIPAADRKMSISGRNLGKIMQQPKFVVAVMVSAISYGVMSLLMTATPLAMDAVQHQFSDTATVIQWHVLGMFVPSFLTGWLIARLGLLRIMFIGGLLNLICILIDVWGTSVAHFLVALLLLGIGWNFMFVGATTLLTQTYAPAEKSKAQATNDFITFSFSAMATILSGRLLNSFGWSMVNYVGFPFILVALIALLWLAKLGEREVKYLN